MFQCILSVFCGKSYSLNATICRDENAFDYELPTDLLEVYHKLLDKKFSTGLTSQEEVELTQLDQQLNDAEAAQPLVQSMQKRETLRDENWQQKFEEVVTKLRELKGLM